MTLPCEPLPYEDEIDELDLLFQVLFDTKYGLGTMKTKKRKTLRVMTRPGEQVLFAGPPGNKRYSRAISLDLLR